MSEPPNDKPPSTSPPKPRAGWVDVGIGALNGVVGDYLQERDNDLALPLCVIHDNRPLEPNAASLREAFPEATPRVCVFAHGLCCTEATWQFPEEPARSYGSLLLEDFGITPVFIRYNTGLHISHNGRTYCTLLHDLVANWPVEVADLTLIGHSMGGLISRSACLYADRLGHDWPDKLHRAVYLGSPHLGAPLEKVGNVAAAVFGKIPDPLAHLARDLINLRSIGIKDLRYANLVDEDWLGHDPDAVLVNTRTSAPLREGMKHYVVAGTLTQEENHLIAQMIGDSLVRVPSATGRPERGGEGLGIPEDRIARFPGFHHMMLAHHPDVYTKLKTWFEA